MSMVVEQERLTEQQARDFIKDLTVEEKVMLNEMLKSLERQRNSANRKELPK